jgi:hypothetical protein
MHEQNPKHISANNLNLNQKCKLAKHQTHKDGIQNKMHEQNPKHISANNLNLK